MIHLLQDIKLGMTGDWQGQGGACHAQKNVQTPKNVRYAEPGTRMQRRQRSCSEGEDRGAGQS